MIDAQFNLGVMYEEGQGVARDTAEAPPWYRQAPERGLAVAQMGWPIGTRTTAASPKILLKPSMVPQGRRAGLRAGSSRTRPSLRHWAGCTGRRCGGLLVDGPGCFSRTGCAAGAMFGRAGCPRPKDEP
jgi:hypothetical protein